MVSFAVYFMASVVYAVIATWYLPSSLISVLGTSEYTASATSPTVMVLPAGVAISKFSSWFIST